MEIWNAVFFFLLGQLLGSVMIALFAGHRYQKGYDDAMDYAERIGRIGTYKVGDVLTKYPDCNCEGFTH